MLGNYGNYFLMLGVGTDSGDLTDVANPFAYFKEVYVIWKIDDGNIVSMLDGTYNGSSDYLSIKSILNEINLPISKLSNVKNKFLNLIDDISGNGNGNDDDDGESPVPDDATPPDDEPTPDDTSPDSNLPFSKYPTKHNCNNFRYIQKITKF